VHCITGAGGYTLSCRFGPRSRPPDRNRSTGAHMDSSRIRRVGSRSGGALLKLLYILVATTVVFVLLGPRLKNAMPGSGIGDSGERSEASKLDPEPFRDRIAAVERRIYENTDGYGVADLSRWVTQLTVAVREDRQPTDRFRAQVRLTEFAGYVSSHTELGYAPVDMDELVARWEETRDAVFRHADWFRKSKREYARSQSP